MSHSVSAPLSSGSYKLFSKDKVLLAIPFGISSDRIAKTYADDLKSAVKKFDGQPWAHIVYLNNWQLGTPEVEPIISELSQWCIANNLKNTALIDTGNSIRQYQNDKMLSKDTQQNDYQRQSFSDVDSAIEWLAIRDWPVNHSLIKTLKQYGI